MIALEILKEVALAHPSISSVGTGDIFQLNVQMNTDYPLVWIDLEQGTSLDLDSIKPSYRLYYVDRLLDDKSNQLDIETDAMYILNQIIYALSEQLPIQTPVTFIPFQQRFNDMCAGGYITLAVQEDLFCNLDLKAIFFPENPPPKVYFSEQFSGDGSKNNPITLKDEIIPSDISDLTDTQDIIPPHLFFDDTYFSGAGTQVDPKSLRTENLPSGGSKRVATWVAEDNETKKVIFDYWDNNDPIEMIDGLHLMFIIKYNTLDGNYNDTSNRCFLRWVENHKFQRIDNAGTSLDIQSLSGELGEKLTTIEIRVLNKKVFARVVEGINDKAQTVREFRSQQDFTTLTGMYINQRGVNTFKAGNTIILYEL